MKKIIMILVCILCLVGCSIDESIDNSNGSEPTDNSAELNSTESKDSGNNDIDSFSEPYSIGDEVKLGDVKFNIYKIDEDTNELYLLAQSNIATTVFSNSERSYKYQHDYEGSLVEGYVNKFVHDLEDNGYIIKSSGIIDKDDLYELGFKKSDGLSGLPYCVDNTPEFVTYEDKYWVTGYCRYESMSWAYYRGQLDTESCDEEYGVRPIVVVAPSEVGKPPLTIDSNLKIQDIVNSDYAWTSEGGIHNPYDLYYFDCENMLFINVFESSELSETNQFSMEFIDDKTILISGLRSWNDGPAKLTIVNENKLRVRFVDDTNNNGDYFLNKTEE